MKTIPLRLAYLSILLSAAFIVNSCSITEEENPDPTDDRDKFIGTWNVSESCSRDSYTVEIVADPTNSSRVIIKNFWLIGYQEKPPYAIVSGSVITIPTQAICNNYSNEVSGSGKLEKNDITWNYHVNDGADLWQCNAVYSPL